MESSIVGFHCDEHGDWVAELACGHGQHMRHDPPWQSRPWTVTAAGRAARLGEKVHCRRCERGEPPAESGRHRADGASAATGPVPAPDRAPDA